MQLKPRVVQKLVALVEVISNFTQAIVTALDSTPSDGSSSFPIDQDRLQSLLPHCIVGKVDLTIPTWVFVVSCFEHLLQSPSIFNHR